MPFDQICSAATCSGKYSPTFFTRRRLTGIDTRTVTAAGADRPLDSFAFAQSMADPGDGTSKSLWLDSITRTGKATSPAITMPPVTFTGLAMDNRVDAVGDQAPPLRRWRVSGITSGTGATTAVTYSAQDCTPTSKPAAPESNTRRCFPVFYLRPGASTPEINYFHKYVVTAVAETDTTTGTPTKTTSYAYVGDPAWHYDDNVLTPVKYRTWGDWRGYGVVETRIGSGTDPKLKSSTLYMRGMNGDHLPTGTRSVTVTDSQGGTLADDAPLAGFPREAISYLGDTGTVQESEITSPWISSPTGTDTSTSPATTAVRVEEAQTTTRTKVSSGYRTTRSSTSYDGYGRDIQVWDEGDITTTGDDICTTSTYTQNTTSWIMDTPATAMAVAKPCGVTPVFPQDLVTGTQMFYDGATSLTAAPSKGQVTRETEADSYAGGAWAYTTTTTTGYDALGRTTTVADALGQTTTTGYTPTATVPATSVATTNPAGQVGTLTMDPGVGPIAAVDPNGRSAAAGYDALGRVVKVWGPGRATNLSPSVSYAYTVSATAANAVTTNTLVSQGTYATSVELFDGLLRPRQTQTPVSADAGGGRLVTTTDYDTRGLSAQVVGPFASTGSPGVGLVAPASLGLVPTIHAFTYDGLGRVTEDMLKVNNVPKWSTTTAYTGDTTTVTPPAGGTVTTTVVDALGRTTALRQHTGATGASGYDETRYTYTPGGQVATITDPAGNVWSNSYDVHGRRVSSSDPDRGTSTSSFDALGRVVTTSDPRGQVLWHGYDSLGRQTQLRTGSAAGTLLASWAFDTVPGGKGLAASSTRYAGGNQYTSSVTGYSAAGLPTGTSVVIPSGEGALAGTYTSSVSYTVSGQVARYTPPSAPGLVTDVQTPVYDALDRPVALDTVDHGVIVPGVVPDVYGNTVQAVLGNTSGKLTTVDLTYEPGTNRLVNTVVARESGAGALDADITYGYNPAGAITSITDTKAGAGGDRQCFSYDYLQRLTQAWAQPGATGGDCASTPSASVLGGSGPYWSTYSYDSTGNRVGEVRHGVGGAGDTTRSYTYKAPSGQGAGTGPHELVSVAETGPGGSRTETTGYDAAGNTTTQTGAAGTQTLDWDQENRLVSVSGPGASSYVYDADGQRLLRRDPGSGVTTLYVGDTEINLTTGTGVKASTRYYTFGGVQVAVRDSTGLSVVVTDPHNTGSFEVNAGTGALTAARRLDPFGAPRTNSAGMWVGAKGFVGGTLDPTGYTQLGARAYQPLTGRFLSIDPIMNPSDPQQLNGYAYANNNPINQADPDGLFANPFSAAWNWGKSKVSKAWRATKKAFGAGFAATRSAFASGVKSVNSGGRAVGTAVMARVVRTRVGRAVVNKVVATSKAVTKAKNNGWMAQHTSSSANNRTRTSNQTVSVRQQVAQNSANCAGGDGGGFACAMSNATLNQCDAQGYHVAPTQAEVDKFNDANNFLLSFCIPGGALTKAPTAAAKATQAANGAGKIPWTSWQNYPKITQGGREYAQVGDRLYTRHAVDRMQPSGLGAPAGASGPGRSISPNYIEDVLGSTKGSPVKGPNGEPRLSYTSGTVQVITENNIVITVITR